MKSVWFVLEILAFFNIIPLLFQQFDLVAGQTVAPLQCKCNEVYSVADACGDLCSLIGINCDMISLYPYYGCVCKPGYARLSVNGTCVRKDDPRCSIQYLPSRKTCANRPRRPNEMFIANGPTCQETCSFYGVPCEPKKTIGVVKGCYCKPNFLREYEDSACIPIDSSRCQFKIPSKEACANRNEVYIEGGSPCQPTCANYGQPCDIRYPKSVNACYCKEGYARLGTRGVCFRLDSEECLTERMASQNLRK